MNHSIFLVASAYIFFSVNSVLANTHMSVVNSRTKGQSKLNNKEKSLPFNSSFGEIYKRKHNVDEKLNLHPSRTDFLTPGRTEGVDDFVVYYPEKKDEKKEDTLPLILGSIGSGLNSEANASLELFPGSLSGILNSISNYFSEAYENMIKRLNTFFEAIDQNLKKSNGSPVIELGDVLF